MNPDLYADLTTRLKYATPPAVKNLVATDQEIDAILRDTSLPLREKRRILSDALNRLQLYKSMIDSENVAASMTAPLTDASSSSSRFTLLLLLLMFTRVREDPNNNNNNNNNDNNLILIDR